MPKKYWQEGVCNKLVKFCAEARSNPFTEQRSTDCQSDHDQREQGEKIDNTGAQQ